MRSGQNKNKKMFIALLIAGLASAAVYFLFQDLNSRLLMQGKLLFEQNKLIAGMKEKENVKKKTNNKNENKTYKYVVAKKSFKKGSKITRDLLLIKTHSEEVKSGYTKVLSLLDKVAKRDILAGEVLTAKNFVERSFKNGYIPKGMRIITIPINFVQGVASYIKVGSKVDVISAQNSQSNLPDYIMQNVEVVALEALQTSRGKDDISAVEASSISLQIPAIYASKLVSAIQKGKVQFIARGFGDNTVINVPEPEVQPLAQVPKKNQLPEPVMPKSQPEKVEMIQANIKSEVTFNK